MRSHDPIENYVGVFLEVFSRRGRDYNFSMARGWESKSVEEQQAEFSQNAHQARQKLTSAEAAQRRESENLRLARIRILRQIDSAVSPRYRELLERTLRDLDQLLQQQ